MSYTDLRLIGRSHSVQLKRGYSMKKSRSLSLTNISNLRKHKYDHVESKVKKYIQQMKEANGQKITSSVTESIPDKVTMNIDASVISQFTPSSEKLAFMEITEKVKLLTNSPKNLENKVEYISNNPEAVYCLLRLLFEERKLRYEQDMTMKTLQLNYDNLLAKYAHTKNSIDSFRLSQEVLTDMTANSSFLSSANYSIPDIKRAFSTPDLSMIDMSSASDMLVKRSYAPVVDPNLGIKLCMANSSENKISKDDSASKFENSSSGNLKAIWIHIFQNLREKLKKCVLLEKNSALEGEDKKVAWNSIHNDFKCLNDIANYQDNIRKSFGAELEDVKFAIHKYSTQFLGSSLILNDYLEIEQFPHQNLNPEVKESPMVTMKPQIRPDKVQTLDKITIVSNRDHDSGCLTSDCSPHHSLNDAKHPKPFYTTSNRSKTLYRHSEDSVDNRCSDSLHKYDEKCYSECSTSSSKGNMIDACKDYGYNFPVRPEVLGNNRDAVAQSSDDAGKQRKYSSHFVQKASSPDSSPPSSRQSYDLTRLENNSHLLKKQLKGKGLLAADGRSQKKSTEDRHSVASSESYNNIQVQHKSHRSLRKHRSMQSIHDGSDDVFEVEFRGVDQFFTSTPKKNYRNHPEKDYQPSTSQSKGLSGNDRTSSTHHRSKSLLKFGGEIKDIMEMTEALKIQSRELLSKYKKCSEVRCKKDVKSDSVPIKSFATIS